MPDDVKPQPARRRYDASRRRAAAAATRLAIIDAARVLFLERGYAATTMAEIADAAGVALDTIYATIGPKPALFRQLIELAISGEDSAVPADERTYVQEIQAEPDPRRKLQRYARAIREIHGRLAPLVDVLREARRGEPELAALWSEIAARRASNMHRFVAEVAATGGLRADIALDEAADLVWATNSPEFYLLLIAERGWTPEQFERWLADLWIRTLLA